MTKPRPAYKAATSRRRGNVDGCPSFEVNYYALLRSVGGGRAEAWKHWPTG